MSAFDRAWALMKAPLDLSSVREFDRDAVTYDKVMGDFIHPETGEIWPMTITTPSLSHDFNINIDYPEGQEPVFDHEIGRKAAQAWVGYHDDEETDLYGPGFSRDSQLSGTRGRYGTQEYPPPNAPLEVHPAVAQHLRRLGMGTAMYDLITALGHNVLSSGNLTDGGDRLWASNLPKQAGPFLSPAEEAEYWRQVPSPTAEAGHRWRGQAERGRGD